MHRLARTIVLQLAVLSPLAPGCKVMDLKEKLPLGQKEEADIAEPQKLVSLWADTIFTQPGRSATRGLGGRLYFYDEKNDPVPVEGQLAVYAFDDSQQESANRAPDRKYVFTPEQLAGHFSPSEFGASYSVWVPWDAAGGVRKDVSLIPVFTTSSGRVVVGEHTKHVLPGTAPPREQDPPPWLASPIRRAPTGSVRPVGYDQPRSEPAEKAMVARPGSPGSFQRHPPRHAHREQSLPRVSRDATSLYVPNRPDCVRNISGEDRTWNRSKFGLALLAVGHMDVSHGARMTQAGGGSRSRRGATRATAPAALSMAKSEGR